MNIERLQVHTKAMCWFLLSTRLFVELWKLVIFTDFENEKVKTIAASILEKKGKVD